MTVERILPDEDFWEEVVSKATLFFKTVILPELVGKVFSKPREKQLRPVSVDDNNNETEDSEVICVCQKVYNASEDDVIGCDGENCQYHWFHFKCVKIKRPPKGSWYCKECRKKSIITQNFV